MRCGVLAVLAALVGVALIAQHLALSRHGADGADGAASSSSSSSEAAPQGAHALIEKSAPPKASQSRVGPEPPKRSAVRPPPMYGAPGKIIGLERCAAWRASTSLFRRSSIAGLFNTGTNLLTNMFRRNCVMPMECPAEYAGNPKKFREAMERKECIGYPFQVPWGKHNPLSWRGEHTVPQLSHFNVTEILPIAVIKDPIMWMRSMCRESYAVKYVKPACCPSPLRPKDNTSSLPVMYKKDKVVSYKSFTHLWSEWYREYLNSPLPRLLIRYEDLLFDSQATLGAICKCAGGQLKPDFDYVSDPAKFGRAHGTDSTGRTKALQRYSSAAKRFELLTPDDFSFLVDAADRDLIDSFHYTPLQVPAEQAAAAAAPDSRRKYDKEGCTKPPTRDAATNRRAREATPVR